MDLSIGIVEMMVQDTIELIKQQMQMTSKINGIIGQLQKTQRQV